jgi:short-subunit dehydrogenase
MNVSLKPLRRQVIVITGASSGIGLATAVMAARHGTRLVLTSRNDEALTEIEKQINMDGGHAVHVRADVGKREELERVAQTAIDHFGGFDTWVNNAGLSIWGKIEQGNEEDYRRLFDTNFWGVVNGSLIAVRHLKLRGGALINVGSIVSDLSVPLQGMYSASKHAVKGFTDALRMELEDEQAPISITLIKPSAIDTPFPHHAKNYTDREPQLPPPVYSPEEVAYAILRAATTPLRDVVVGGGGRVMTAINKAAPWAMDWINERIMIQQQLSDEPPRDPEGALHKPGKDGQIHGDYPGHVMKTSLYTRASLHPWITAGVLAAVGVGAMVMLAGRSED